jgi:hypothetical protein
VLAATLARRYLPVGVPGGGEVNRSGAKLDLPGLVLIAVAVLSLLNGMVQLHGASRGSGIGTGAGLLALSVAATLGFVSRQRRTAQPLMALGLFTHRSFAMGSVVAFIYGMALFGSTYLVPVFMQLALRLPPSTAGAVLLPAGIALAITIPLAGRLTDKLPVARLVSTGLLLLAASFLLMVTVGAATALVWITLWATIGRVGLGFVLPSLNLGAMRGLPDVLISQGASAINFMRQLGGAVGVSGVGIVLEWRLQAQPADPLRAFHETFVLVGSITALAVLAALRMGPGKTTAQASLPNPPAS